MLLIASVFIVLIGIAHSVLGERFIIKRLLKRDNLPKIYGSDDFTKGTIRFAWHITTLAWFGLAVICLLLADSDLENSVLIQLSISITFALSGLVSLYFSKAKHFSWPVFLLISGLSFPYELVL